MTAVPDSPHRDVERSLFGTILEDLPETTPLAKMLQRWRVFYEMTHGSFYISATDGFLFVRESTWRLWRPHLDFFDSSSPSPILQSTISLV